MTVRVPPRPDPQQLERLGTFLDPVAKLLSPSIHGIDRIPDGGSLLVGNHTIYGFLDLPFMMRELRRRRGIVVRGLGEHAHYAIPGWRDGLELAGMVRGTRENVHELMRQREYVLVFPGGAREVNKRKGEKYQLMWKERLGFAKLAIEHGYPITPFAAVGAEEMLDILVDQNNPVYGAIARVLTQVTGWPPQPIVTGIGPTMIPKPQRLYFWFGATVDTAHYGGEVTDDNARALRDTVKAAVEGGIAEMLAHRETDGARALAARLRKALRPARNDAPPLPRG